MLKRLQTCALLGILISLLGCQTRTAVVIDSTRDVVRLGPDVRGKVYVWQNGQWQLTGKRVKLPEGWYAGPPPTSLTK
jgi:hypothetical protein